LASLYCKEYTNASEILENDVGFDEKYIVYKRKS
jgi:hypothetical protein